MHVSMSEIIGNFILIAGSLPIINLFNKEICMEQYQWNFRSACQKITMILMEQNQLVKKLRN